MSGTPLSTYMSATKSDLPYCPGCGHTTLVQSLDAALVELGRDPRDIVIVTDIGCIGLSDRDFVTSAFHGLHGRSITYACGIKLARPELDVITIMGDGACGIGGAHLLNVARRNIGITLLIANNFNYGMTGGQHSVTTPAEARTATTPMGNLERHMDICRTTAAAGAPWVYRGTTFDKDLPATIVKAIRQPGFALVDVWELCTAYYMPRNDFKKSDLIDLVGHLGLEWGQIVDEPRSEYGALYRDASAKVRGKEREPRRIEVTHGNAVVEQCGVLIAGSAGLKVKSAATTFARAAIASGLCATQKDDYPITIMTGHSLSEIVLGAREIEYTGIASPEHVICISDEGVARTRQRLSGLSADSTIYADEGLTLPETEARVLRFPFAKVAKRVGRLGISTLALSTFLERSGLFPLEALAATIRASQKPAIAEQNLAALAAGVELARGVDD